MEASALRHGSLAPWAGPLRGRGSDDRLVASLRAGRTAAFTTIYERYSAPLLSFCRHMLGSREEAEDAVQHTFAAAYDHLRRSDKPIQLRPWLYAIARNRCVSVLRARRQHVSIEDVEPAVEGLAPAVARREDLREVLRDLSRLPEDQRAALLLSELGSLSHEEIGEVVGCRKEKVKALVFQARSSLAAGREARETPCTEIREALATLSGGSLLRTGLRRHLRDCPGCRDFRTEVKRQRQAIAVLFPVMPTAALKTGVMSGVAAKAGAGVGAGAAGGGAAATGGGVGAVLANAGTAKLLMAGALALAGAAGTVTSVSVIEENAGHRQAPRVSPNPGAPSATPASFGVTFSGVVPTRAHGVQGTRTGAVANGASPNGEDGRSETAPGNTGTAPGLAGTAPGLAGTAPGLAGTTPGKNGSAPGHAKVKSPGHQPPGHAKPKSKDKGNSGSAPGHTKTKSKDKSQGGNHGGGEGNSGAGQDTPAPASAPGNSGSAPGATGTSPGQVKVKHKDKDK